MRTRSHSKHTMAVKQPVTRDYHPAKSSATAKTRRRKATRRVLIPDDQEDVELRVADREVRLTNLDKLFWPELGITKRHLLQYYADIAPVLLPHLQDRAMVMKRY